MAKKNQGAAKKNLAPAPKAAADFTPTAETTGTAQQAAAPISGEKKMENITLVRSDKQRSTNMVVFTVEGRPGSVRFSKTLFTDKKAPEKIEVSNEAIAGPKAERKQETKEERKARLAALPKPTAAEKIERMEAKLAKLRTKVAAPAPALEGAGSEAAAV